MRHDRNGRCEELAEKLAGSKPFEGMSPAALAALFLGATQAHFELSRQLSDLKVSTERFAELAELDVEKARQICAWQDTPNAAEAERINAALRTLSSTRRSNGDGLEPALWAKPWTPNWTARQAYPRVTS